MKHKRPSSVLVLDSDVSELCLLVERHAGVILEQPCENLRVLIAEQSEMRHLKSGADLINLLRSSAVERDVILDAVLVDDGDFFRHPAAFEHLQKETLPEIVRKKASRPPSSLRMWSAGCGTGEEAYSLAISVCEALNGGSSSWKIHIVASDIRPVALKVAERGLYPESKLTKVPEDFVSAYFSRVGNHLLVKPRLRNLVTFSSINLTHPNFFGYFDCIFCMDVLPHFSASQRGALLHRLCMFLEPGGCLFFGDHEKIQGEITLEYARPSNCTYYRRPLAAVAGSGR